MRFICCLFLMGILLSGVTAKLWKLDPIEARQETQEPTKETVVETQELIKETEEIKPKEVSSCPKDAGYEVTVLKQIIGKLLKQFQPYMIPGEDEKEEEFNMKIKLSASDLNKISSYLAKNEDIFEVEDILTSMLGEVSLKNMLLELPQTFYEKYSIYVSIILPVVVLLLALKFMHLPFWALVRLNSFLILWVSVIWNWYFLYQENYTKYTTAIENGLPDHCKKEYQSGFFESLSTSFAEIFHTPIDECEQYHLMTSIPPGLRVPPTEAISFCIVNTLLKPLASVGENIGLFFQKLSQQIPFPLLIAVVIFILIVLLFLIIVSCGYSIGGLFISLTPPQPTPPPPPPPPPPPQLAPKLEELKEKLNEIMVKLDELPNINDVKEIREGLQKMIANENQPEVRNIENGPNSGDHRHGVQETQSHNSIRRSSCS